MHLSVSCAEMNHLRLKLNAVAILREIGNCMEEHFNTKAKRAINIFMSLRVEIYFGMISMKSDRSTRQKNTPKVKNAFAESAQ